MRLSQLALVPYDKDEKRPTTRGESDSAANKRSYNAFDTVEASTFLRSQPNNQAKRNDRRRYRWKVACFSSPRRLPAHVIREEKAASGSSLSRATGRRLLSEGLRWRKRSYSHSIEMFALGMKMDERRFEAARPKQATASPYQIKPWSSALARFTWRFAHPLAGRGKPGTDEIRGKHGIGHYTGGGEI
ncbi:hypothetical protein RYX36_009906 [Vicia faba]